MQRIRHHNTLILIGVCVLLWSCAPVRFISEYDEQTDNAITKLHRTIETFLHELASDLESGTSEFEQYRDVYRLVSVDISALKLRVSAKDKNDLQVKQAGLLLESWHNLEKLHKLGLTAEQIPPLRDAFNISLTAMLRLEIAKKRVPITKE